MTTAPARPLYGPNGQAINGSTRPAVGLPFRAGDWRPVRPVGDIGAVWEKDQTPTVAPMPDRPEAAADPIAEAKAEAIRLKAEAEAQATRIKAAEEAERQRLANERATMRLERERAEHEAKVAAANRRKEEEDRQAREAREKQQAEQAATTAEQDKRQASAESWRRAALGFAIVCAIVALPVQMSAFYNRHALWLLAAPFVLEGLAWVVLRGAAAAVDEHRPHWHYRLIAWAAAFIAASINLAHGLSHFDLATATGTAFASLAGPGVWDLHEHGRIRVRDGKLTRTERKKRKHAEKRAAAEKAAAETQAKAAKQAAAEAAKQAAEKLARDRAETYPKEWQRALQLAAALGETMVTEAIWRRAWKDIHGADPGETVDVVRSRNMAVTRMARALAEGSDKTPSKVTSTQRASQVPSAAKPRRYAPPAVRGVRRQGDTPKYVNAARTQASIAAKKATENHPRGV